jgi:hypothetical protein
MQFEYTPPWQERVRQGNISQDELNYALNNFNNVALSTMYLIQIHKPGRIDFDEFERMIQEKLKEPMRITSKD